MKILVVDDVRSMRQVLTYMLSSLGHSNVDEASNGIEALKLLRLNEYDLLITDLHMPNLDGKQLLEQVRNDKNLSHLPVLMASSEDDKSRILDVIAADVTAFMMKPFNISTLRRQLDLLERKENVA